MTTNRDGKIMKTSGKSILIGAFCGLLLGERPPALAHLDGEVAKDLPDGHAEQLTLHHRPGERLDRRGRAAADHVLERLNGGESPAASAVVADSDQLSFDSCALTD